MKKAAWLPSSVFLHRIRRWFMNDLNSVLLEGKLTKDPDLKFMGEDINVCTFPIAVNRRYIKKGGNGYTTDTSYFIIESWGTMALNCGQYLTKGRGIRVSGRLKQYKFKQNGIPREMVYVVAEHIEFQPQKTLKDNAKPDGQTKEEPVEKADEHRIIRQTEEENEKLESSEVKDALDQGAYVSGDASEVESED